MSSSALDKREAVEFNLLEAAGALVERRL